MVDNPTRISSQEDDSTLVWLDIGHTEGDAAGRVYIQDTASRVAFFKPTAANLLRLALVEHIKVATADAATQKVTIPVTSTTTDAEIVSMVRSRLTT